MKILKLKSTLFSFIAIATVTVLLTSCEKGNINPLTKISTEQLTANQEHYEKVNLFLNDANFVNKTEADINEFIRNLSPKDIVTSKNDYMVAEYLESVDLLDKVISDNQTVPLSKMDLSSYIDELTLEELNSEFSTEEELSLREDCWYSYKQITIRYLCKPICLLALTPYPCKPFCEKTIWIKCD